MTEKSVFITARQFHQCFELLAHMRRENAAPGKSEWERRKQVRDVEKLAARSVVCEPKSVTASNKDFVLELVANQRLDVVHLAAKVAPLSLAVVRASSRGRSKARSDALFQV